MAELLKAMQTKLITSEQLVEMYMARIAAYEDARPAVNAFIHINADAVVEAHQVDLHRHPGRARRPLEGIPVLLKDKIKSETWIQSYEDRNVLIGLAAIPIVTRAWARRPRPDAAAAGPPPTDEEARRLDEELRRLG